MSEKEIWKDVKGYEGYYQVSNLGNVKSLKRKWNINEFNLKQSLNGSKYLTVKLSKDNICKTIMVHRLVISMFKINKYNKRTINHINGIRVDNRLENLEWSTHSENHCHAYKMGIRKGVRLNKKGSLCPKAKAVIQYDEHMNLINEFTSIRQASKSTKITEYRIAKYSLSCKLCDNFYFIAK